MQVEPAAASGSHLQTRRFGHGQQRDHIDVFVGCGAQAALGLITCERRVMQDAEHADRVRQHVGELECRVVLVAVIERSIEPAHERSRELERAPAVVSHVGFECFRHRTARARVEELFDVLVLVTDGALADIEPEVAKLCVVRLAFKPVVELVVAGKERAPVLVEPVEQRLGQRMIAQHGKARLMDGADEGLCRVGRSKIDSFNSGRGRVLMQRCGHDSVRGWRRAAA